jgi:glycosyltransferase involved in cell wall biosynthesis
MHKLSAVIITLNEEKNIDRCLKSLENIVDEIIIVDSNSTDNTIKIASQYGAKIFQQEWLGYSKQKNYANSLAQNEYILSLDADEALSTELSNSILNLKTVGFNGAYSFNRLNNYCGKWIKHTAWYPDKKLRIWNKNEGSWTGDIHEEVTFKNSVNKHHLKGDLLHYSFYSIEEHVNVINKFSTSKAETLYKKGKKANLFKLLFKPFVKFFIIYIIKLGFLDGYYGFVISKNSAFSDHLKFLKLRELYKNAKK